MTDTSFEEALTRLWPTGDAKIPGLRAGMIASAPRVFAKYGIVTPLHVIHLMAQLSHECGAGHEVEENLSYSAKRMMEVWPSRFPTMASALPYAKNPRKLADKTYNGRMGNRPGSDDGYDFRGRGGSQTTGREGYARLAQKTGLDLLNKPELVNDPRYFLECAVADFVLCGCLPYCAPRPGLPDGDIRGVTHHLNGGYIGLEDRKAWFARWKAALRTPARLAAPVGLADVPDTETDEDEAPEAAVEVDDGVLRYGRGHDAPDFEVKALQELLVSRGYQVGSVDGDFGRGTRVAVLAAQADNGLPTNGEVDTATKAAFKAMPAKPISEKRATATADDLRADGSETVVKADKMSWWGKALLTVGIGGGGGKGAEKAGLLDTVNDATGHISQVRDVVSTIQDVGGWVVSMAASYWWVLALVAGYFGVKYGRDIIKQRLADHRDASNMRF
jgi:putative chitinase